MAKNKKQLVGAAGYSVAVIAHASTNRKAPSKSMLNTVETAVIQTAVGRALSGTVRELNIDQIIGALSPARRFKIDGRARQLVGEEIALKQLQNGKNKVGKLHEVAKRISETKAMLEAEADKMVVELDALNAKAPEAFSMGHAIIQQHRSDIDAMEDDLRQISNLPPPLEK